MTERRVAIAFYLQIETAIAIEVKTGVQL